MQKQRAYYLLVVVLLVVCVGLGVGLAADGGGVEEELLCAGLRGCRGELRLVLLPDGGGRVVGDERVRLVGRDRHLGRGGRRAVDGGVEGARTARRQVVARAEAGETLGFYRVERTAHDEWRR